MGGAENNFFFDSFEQAVILLTCEFLSLKMKILEGRTQVSDLQI